MLKKILESIQNKLLEVIELRDILIGDDDLAATQLPGATINVQSVRNDLSAVKSEILEAEIVIKLHFPPTISAIDMQVITKKVLESLDKLDIPDFARVSKIVARITSYNIYKFYLLFRWGERME